MKAESRESWGVNPYAPLADLLRPAAVELVRACGIGPGMRVLDVAAGNGNAAVEAVRAGAEAVASDLAPLQVEQGRERTRAEGLDIEWVEADAEELPFEDGSFDASMSVFGAMFAPRVDRAAAELFRVVRPGGTVGMANWRPDGFQARFFDVLNRYRDPDPPGVEPASLWGDEEHVRERFGPHADEVRVEPRMLPWQWSSLQEMGEFFAATRPGGSAAGMSEERRQQLAIDVLELVQEHNTAEGGAVYIDSAYSIVVARRKS
ncbi:MAG TPA: class I SAM-dependent methyltransferase [Thermoleophilaceae bacterium]|jgi:SAM-dependent methyltransferase